MNNILLTIGFHGLDDSHTALLASGIFQTPWSPYLDPKMTAPVLES